MRTQRQQPQNLVRPGAPAALGHQEKDQERPKEQGAAGEEHVDLVEVHRGGTKIYFF